MSWTIFGKYTFPPFIKQIAGIDGGRSKLHAVVNLDSELQQLRNVIKRLQKAEAVILEELENRKARRKEILSELGEFLLNSLRFTSHFTISRDELDKQLTDDRDRILFSGIIPRRKKQPVPVVQPEPEERRCDVGGFCEPCVGMELCVSGCPHKGDECVGGCEPSESKLTAAISTIEELPA